MKKKKSNLTSFCFQWKKFWTWKAYGALIYYIAFYPLVVKEIAFKFTQSEIEWPKSFSSLDKISRYVSRMVKLRWNTTKRLSTIWQHFSCLLDEGIAKICKKLKSHGCFLSYLQDRTANPANLAAIFCPALVCPQKTIVGIKFLAYLCSPLVK